VWLQALAIGMQRGYSAMYKHVAHLVNANSTAMDVVMHVSHVNHRY
jgi:hypothetical protein